MDTQNDGLEKVTPLKKKMAIFGIHVSFRGSTHPKIFVWNINKWWFPSKGSTNSGRKMGAPDGVDVFPIKNGDIPTSYVS